MKEKKRAVIRVRMPLKERSMRAEIEESILNQSPCSTEPKGAKTKTVRRGRSRSKPHRTAENEESIHNQSPCSAEPQGANTEAVKRGRSRSKSRSRYYTVKNEESINNQSPCSAEPQGANTETVKRGRSRPKIKSRRRGRRKSSKVSDRVLDEEDLPMRLEGFCFDHKVGIAVFTALCCSFFWWL